MTRIPFPIWFARVAKGMRAAGVGALNFRAAVEYLDTGYTPDEVVSIEAGEAVAAENARISDEPYGWEHRYP